MSRPRESGTVFLGGPIQHAFAGNLFDPRLRRGLETLAAAASEAGWRVLSAHLTERFSPEQEDFAPVAVCKRDYGWMLESDVYIAVLPTDESGRPTFSGGTYIEIGWASAHKTPIVVLWDERNAAAYSHLVRGLHATCDVRYIDLSTCVRDTGVFLHALSGG